MRALKFLCPAIPSLRLHSTQPLPQDRRVYSRTTNPIKELALETSYVPSSLWPSVLHHSPSPFDSTLSFKIFTFIMYFSWILGTPTSSPHFRSIEQCRFAPMLIQTSVFRIHSQPAWQLGVSGTLRFPPSVCWQGTVRCSFCAVFRSPASHQPFHLYGHISPGASAHASAPPPLQARS